MQSDHKSLEMTMKKISSGYSLATSENAYAITNILFGCEIREGTRTGLSRYTISSALGSDRSKY